jgi:hypothetical protein
MGALGVMNSLHSGYGGEKIGIQSAFHCDAGHQRQYALHPPTPHRPPHRRTARRELETNHRRLLPKQATKQTIFGVGFCGMNLSIGFGELHHNGPIYLRSRT